MIRSLIGGGSPDIGQVRETLSRRRAARGARVGLPTVLFGSMISPNFAAPFEDKVIGE